MWCGQIYTNRGCCSVVSDSLWPHGLQHTRFPCHFTTSRSLLKLMSIESVMSFNHLILCHPLLLLPLIFPSIRVFSSGQIVFSSGGQSIGASASASVLSINIQGWSPLGLIGLISLESKDFPEFFSTMIQTIKFFMVQKLDRNSVNLTWIRVRILKI